jgi:transposase-like protein
MVNIRDLIDDAKCYQTVREMRWPDRTICPHCSSESVIKDGRDDTQLHRQRYLCHGCQRRFDDLTGTIFAGHHQPLRTWILCLYFMGLNLSSLQIAKELDMDRNDVQAMVQQLRQGIVDRRPAVVLEGEVECDEVDVVAGHKGNPEAVKKKVDPGAAAA